MEKRTGEKIGWIGGWFGGFIWVFILSVIFLIQGKQIEGLAGLVLECIALVLIFSTAPWKHPNTAYWKLMIPIYFVLFGSVLWMLWSFGGAKEIELSWWNLFLIFPLLIPFGTTGKRRWNNPAHSKVGSGSC